MEATQWVTQALPNLHKRMPTSVVRQVFQNLKNPINPFGSHFLILEIYFAFSKTTLLLDL